MNSLPENYQAALVKTSAISFLNELGSLFAAPAQVDSDQVIPLLEWMRLYRAYLVRGRVFDLRQHKYLEFLYKDNYHEIIFAKAGQVGVSELLVSWMLWGIDQYKVNGLYVFPKERHILDFSAARLGPAMEMDVSPYLAGIVGKVDRVDLKRIGDRFLYMRGAQVTPDGRAPQLKSMDVDLLVLDEFDEMPPAAPAIARERLGHAAMPMIRIASTPRFSGMGIWQEYLKTDRRLWFIACNHCGNRQDVNINDLVIEFDDLERPLKWHKNDKGRPFLACRKCGKQLDRGGPGEWVAEYPSQEVHGYHLSRLFAPFASLQDIIDKLRETDESIRQEITNQGLGLPYSSPTAYRLSMDILNDCRRNYGLSTQTQSRSIFMGVDVGKLFNVVIRERISRNEGGEERKALFIGTVKEWADIAQLIKLYNVQVAVIDALPETRGARKLQDQFPRGKIWLAYYPATIEGNKKESPFVWRSKDTAVHIDRTRSLDSCLAAFVDAARGEPGKTLPANAQNIPDYYAQMTSSERRLQDKKGKEVPVYVEIGPDHYLHAENYEHAAAHCPIAERWGKGV